MHTILTFFDRVNDMRINVILNYFLLVSFFVFKSQSQVSSEDRIAFAAIATAFVGFSYLFNRYTDYHYDIVVDGTEIKLARRTYLWISFGYFAVGSLLLLENPEYFPVLIIGAIFGIPYSVPTILKEPFKNYLFLKTIYSSGSKTAVIFYWLQCFTTSSLSESIAMSFIFFCSHTVFGILWDVRDIEADRVGHVRTIPNVYGVGAALTVATAANITGFLIDMSVFDTTVRDLAFFGLAGVLILLTEFVRHPRFFHTMIYCNIITKLFFVNDREFGILIGAARLFFGKILPF